MSTISLLKVISEDSELKYKINKLEVVLEH
jgi:hypothetical protein